MFLLMLGAFVFIVGYNGIAAHYNFVPGALYGLAVVANDAVSAVSLAKWYLMFNVPLFAAAWTGVSKRFFFLNLLTMGAIALMTSHVQLDLGIRDGMNAAIAAGALMGAGSGIILRSYGGGGGLDVLAVILNRKYGVRFGVFYFAVNGAVMLFALSRYSSDTIVSSLVMLFISSIVTEYVLSLFNQRKAVRVITRKGDAMVRQLTETSKFHATVIPARGGYSGAPMDMVYSITDNLRLRALEEIIFAVDPEAVLVVENTFSVLGGSIASRKTY
ncbi:YitT family protein [Desulfovibrio mangrovi]|uniref:YitT family protein n=1 Tax=Desulfovibrio mangrovi TaxID=2976983 RepID=UPI00224827F1|nr:YitT family protein [Desulfovibrio mangrovi]UZP66622.1 YitT family protein [Desulfovibrio mangrovi]